MRVRYIVGVVLALLPVAASASETVTYRYDAKGRLIAVVHGGSVNNGTVATYAYDAADNRTSQQVSGATGRLVVVSMSGFHIIPIK